MSPSLKSLVGKLSKRGPNRVLRGDLAFAGIPGVVYTPQQGLSLPAVAFGHHWLVPPKRYADTLAHLASWGIVAAAPATQKGPVPSTRQFAADLNAVLDICVGVRLGPGEISVHPKKLAVAGHGLGAGAAVLAAREGKAAAVAALYPAPTSPPAEESAPHLSVPALILAAEGDLTSLSSNAQRIARAWAGPTVLRAVSKASSGGLPEGRTVGALLGMGKPDGTTQKMTRAMLVGFLLHELTGDSTYAAFSDPEAGVKKKATAVAANPEDPAEEEPGGHDLSRIFT